MSFCRMQSAEGLININDYFPFLTSMGMDVILVIENMNKIVLTKRSKQLINMKEDKWHLSMNEVRGCYWVQPWIDPDGAVGEIAAEDLDLQFYWDMVREKEKIWKKQR